MSPPCPSPFFNSSPDYLSVFIAAHLRLFSMHFFFSISVLYLLNTTKQTAVTIRSVSNRFGILQGFFVCVCVFSSTPIVNDHNTSSITASFGAEAQKENSPNTESFMDNIFNQGLSSHRQCLKWLPNIFPFLSLFFKTRMQYQI